MPTRWASQAPGQPKSGSGESGDDVAGDGFASADGIDAFVGLSFQVDAIDRYTQGCREGVAHFGEMRAEFWALKNDDDVDVVDDEKLFLQQFADVFKKQKAVGAFPLGIGVGEVRADVTESGRAEQRVAKGVGYNIAVGMADGPFVKGHLGAADDELAPFGEAMQIVPQRVVMPFSAQREDRSERVPCRQAW